MAQIFILKSASRKRMMPNMRDDSEETTHGRRRAHWDAGSPAINVPNSPCHIAPFSPTCPKSPKLEYRRPADQLDHPATDSWGGSCTATPDHHPALRLIAARPDIFIRQGYIAATYRRRNGKTYGPYYLLAYRDSGRQCSVYLGRAGELVERVRAALVALQGPRAELRQFTTMERQIRVALRVEKRHLASLLRPFGLRMKGFEVRGWRFSSLVRRPPAFRIRLSALRRLRLRTIAYYAESRSRLPSGTWATSVGKNRTPGSSVPPTRSAPKAHQALRERTMLKTKRVPVAIPNKKGPDNAVG
jgi:hypothetical protein